MSDESPTRIDRFEQLEEEFGDTNLIIPSDPPKKWQCTECGNETYHIKTTVDRTEVWAQCAECGRPTGVMGDGLEKLHD